MNRRALPWIALAALTVIALVVRTWAAAAIVFPSVDGVNYMTVARTLVGEGRLQFSTFPPGWSLVMSVPLLGFGTTDGMDVLRAAQSANVVLGTALVPLVFLLLRPAFGAIVASAGAAVIALLPDLVILSSVDLSEMSYTAFFVAAWVLWHRDRRRVAGAVFGFAYLIRPEALIVLGALLVVTSIVERRVVWRPLVAALPFVIAYVLFAHDATGQWTLSGKTAFLDRAAQADDDPLRRWFSNAGALLDGLPAVVGLPLVLVAVWGMVRRRGAELVVFLPMLLLPVFTFRMEARYWIPLVPFLLWFAAAGARDLVARVPGARDRILVAAAVAVVVLGGVGFAGSGDVQNVGRNHEAFSGLREAGRWIAANSAPDDVVVGYKPYAAFWAGRRHAKLPVRDDILSTVDRIRERGHDFLVVNVTLARSVTPQLLPLLTGDEVDPRVVERLRLVHVTEIEGDPRQTTAIFRVVPVGG